MAGGLVGLFDDIAALAKLAAASIDDVGAAAGKASVKAAGVVVDDTAVTPAYVHGLAAERELPIIKRIAKGSIRNKVLFILPAALVLSQFLPIAVEIILMCGGAYLSYEGAHKIHHRLSHHASSDHSGGGHAADGDAGAGGGEHGAPAAVPAALTDQEIENKTVASAVRTDFILSAEIMVIALKEVIDEGFVSRSIILLIVAALITAMVYGVVALIVKMDDMGLALAEREDPRAKRFGRGLVAAMPKVLAVLSSVGTVAMLWVGGHILVAGCHELGWHGPRSLIHAIEDPVHHLAVVGGIAAWFADTALSAVVGLIVGFALVVAVTRLTARRTRT
ncbi:MAG TPA: DUF808 domain-containing protein [Ilumatobacteraceae bacterium]|nr:DUF808 domain-containing protein [Ilumatobacteraceae bacterium]